MLNENVCFITKCCFFFFFFFFFFFSFAFSLQIGQLALFMLDEHGNYLALSVDTKTYYLTADCVPRLPDLAPRMSRVQLQRCNDLFFLHQQYC